MKFLRPRSADSGLVTVLLVSDVELAMLVHCVDTAIKIAPGSEVNTVRRKLKAELETARKAL